MQHTSITLSAGHRIAQALRSEILSGKLRPGQRLPPEQKIGEHFDVSRVTVREGLRILQDESLIYKRQGSGSYVSARSQRYISLVHGGYTSSITPYLAEMFRKVDAWRWIEADEYVAGCLQINPGQSVLWARRRDFLHDEPVAQDELWLEGSVATRVTLADLKELTFLERWESVQQVEVGHVHQSISAMAATTALSRALKIKRGQPVLRETCLTYLAEHDVPSGLFISDYRNDVFHLESIVRHRD